MKKILYVASAAKKHICRFHLPYLKWFTEQGHIVHVAAGDDYHEEDERVVPFCDELFLLPMERSPFSGRNIKAYKSLEKIMDENRYNLVICNTPVGAALGRLAARKIRKQGSKVIYISHGFHFYKGCPKTYKIYCFVEKWLVRYTDALITINIEDCNTARRFCRGKKCEVYYVHGMGVDTKKFSLPTCPRETMRENFGVPQDATLLVSVSEINGNKNIYTIIKALSELKDENLYYIACGEGEGLEKASILAKELGLKEHVIFLGTRNDIANVLHASDIFLMPSFREGLGMAGIEAMSAGLPVIASDIRGIREYAVNGKNSILLSPTDIKGFAGAIRKICDDGAFRERLAENAEKSVDAFDLDNSKKAFIAIFEKYL